MFAAFIGPAESASISDMTDSDASFDSSLPGLNEYTELLEWLEPVTYDHPQIQSIERRHPGTVQWFLDSEPYQEWILARSNGNPDGRPQDLHTLFCPGPAGAGKTVLASAVIQDLDHRFSTDSASEVGIAYIYCGYYDREEQLDTNLLLVLLDQLVPIRPRGEPRARLPCYAREDDDSSTDSSCAQPSPARIAELLKVVVAAYDRVFFIIDALDECAPETRARILDEIFRLQTQGTVHLLATSNIDAEVAQMFANTASLAIRADEDDIRSYLERCMVEPPAFIKDEPGLEEEIKDCITRAASGR